MVQLKSQESFSFTGKISPIIGLRTSLAPCATVGPARLWISRGCGSREAVDLARLWISRGCGSREAVDLARLWISRGSGSREALDLARLWISRGSGSREALDLARLWISRGYNSSSGNSFGHDVPNMQDLPGVRAKVENSSVSGRENRTGQSTRLKAQSCAARLGLFLGSEVPQTRKTRTKLCLVNKERKKMK